MAAASIGTVDLPDRLERERYFHEMSYLELSALFHSPLKPSALAKWNEVAPKGSIGLVAPWVLTQRTPPKSANPWKHDTTVGDFRDSDPGRYALAELRKAVDQIAAPCVIFKSPNLFAASAANRDQLKWFFGELATAEAVGTERVWVPDGLWEPRTAVAVAKELGITVALDPLIRDPSLPVGQSFEAFLELAGEMTSVYLRISGLGRAGTIRSELLEDLAMLVEHYVDAAELTVRVVFESNARWQDARNFKKQLEAAND